MDKDETPRHFWSAEKWYVCVGCEAALDWIIYGEMESISFSQAQKGETLIDSLDYSGWTFKSSHHVFFTMTVESEALPPFPTEL